MCVHMNKYVYKVEVVCLDGFKWSNVCMRESGGFYFGFRLLVLDHGSLSA